MVSFAGVGFVGFAGRPAPESVAAVAGILVVSCHGNWQRGPHLENFAEVLADTVVGYVVGLETLLKLHSGSVCPLVVVLFSLRRHYWANSW